MPEVAGPIDINTADAAALQTLPGIGKTKAEAIIAHREANGLFATVDDLQNVKGIGEKTLEKLKEQITVGASEITGGTCDGIAAHLNTAIRAASGVALLF